MPYQIKGKSLVKKDTGKVVGKSNNPKKYVKTLRAVEHGWKKTEGGKMKALLQLMIGFGGAYVGISMCYGFSLGAFWAGAVTVLLSYFVEEVWVKK